MTLIVSARGRCLVLALLSVIFLAGGLAAFPGPGPNPGAKTAPNLLLITIDTLRADRVSSYGGRLETQSIDRLAA